jgi:hypothetical protein
MKESITIQNPLDLAHAKEALTWAADVTILCCLSILL